MTNSQIIKELEYIISCMKTSNVSFCRGLMIELRCKLQATKHPEKNSYFGDNLTDVKC